MEDIKRNKPKRYSAMDKTHFPFVYIILILPVSQFIIFWLYVNFSTLANSFVDVSGKLSFESIIRVAKGFTSTDLDRWGFRPLEMLGKSILIWGNLHILCTVIGIFTAYMLTRHMVLSKTMRIIYMIPSLVGGVVFSSIMKQLFAYDGAVIQLFNSLGIKVSPLIKRNGFLGDDNSAFLTLYIQMFVLSITGGNMIIAGAYMKIPQEIFESAEIEGCGFFREGFQIAIPCIWPTISTMMVFSLCSFFTADYSFYLYSDGTGRNGLVSMGYYLYQFQVKVSEVVDSQYLVGYTSALGMFLTFITIPVVILGQKLLKKIGSSVDF